MKPIFPLICAAILSACVAPDMPVEAFEAANPAIAENQCRSAAAREGLTGPSGPSGLSAVMTVGGAASGEARCSFEYATGKATITLF
jgi:hypothetical protein